MISDANGLYIIRFSIVINSQYVQCAAWGVVQYIPLSRGENKRWPQCHPMFPEIETDEELLHCWGGAHCLAPSSQAVHIYCFIQSAKRLTQDIR